MPMLDRVAVENRLELLHRTLGELRPPRRWEKRLSPIVVADRIDHLGYYLDIDPAAQDLLGYPPSYYETEQDWVQFNHTLDLGRTALLWERALSGQPCHGVEYRSQHADGYWVWLEDSFVPILTDPRGRGLVIEGHWRDITPRKRLEIEFLIRQLELSLRTLRTGPRPERGAVLRFPRRDKG
jgi:PAS domain S-box-containing protein